MEEEISSFINQMIGQIQIVEPTKKINLVGKKFNSNRSQQASLHSLCNAA